MSPFSKYLIVILLAFTAVNAGAQIPRHDTVECLLPDGSTIELKSRYLWIPVNLNPMSSKTRERNDPFHITIKLKGHFRAIESVGELGGITLQTVDQGRKLCEDFGAFQNNIYTPYETIRLKDHKSFPIADHRPNTIPAIKSLRTKEDAAILTENAVEASNDNVIKIRADGTWVNEQALYTLDFKTIKAVFKSESTDEGKTWTPGIISTAPEIFELSKPLREQTFIARPIKVNGKKVYD